MALSFVGSATGGSSATLPTHQAGDIIIAWAYRNGSATAPSLPSGGWASLSTVAHSTFCAGRVAYLVATGAGTSSGVWSNATDVVFHIYRPTSSNYSIRAALVATNNSFSPIITYSGATLTVTDGNSWVAGFAGKDSSGSAIATAPSGMLNRSSRNNEVGGHDTNGGVSSWSNTGVSQGPSSNNWVSATVEIYEQATVGAGAVTDSVSVAGVGASTAASAGAISDGATVAGVGASIAAAVGSISIGATVAGVVPDVATGAGAAAPSVAVSGVGASIAEAVGTISIGATPAAAATAIKEAVGTISVGATMAGVLSAIAAAVGVIIATGAPDAEGTDATGGGGGGGGSFWLLLARRRKRR